LQAGQVPGVIWVFSMTTKFYTSAPVRTLAALVVALGIAVSSAAAQSKYPDRPVRVVTTFAAGGLADITARLVADKLSEKLGQRFFIENQPGAGGIAAARAVLSGGNDGYTLAFITNGTAISAALFEHLPFDPLKDFVPISGIGNFDCVFVTSTASPLHSLQDFLKAARDKPGTINVGTVNIGSTQHLTAALFKSMAGINVVLIPFRSTPDVVVALLRDDVQMAIDFYAPFKSGLESGKLRPIATSAPQRTPELPDVPTVQESGVADFDVTSWNSLYAPAGTPPAIIATLNQALRDVLADPDLKRRALDLGIETKGSSGAEVDARMRSDIAKWSKLIAEAHIPRQ
jgi:tripartite-type tricarboxylate transporter receptor subunit TctC